MLGLCGELDVFRRSGLVEGAVAEHGEQDADALTGESEEGLGVGLAACSLTVVVSAGGGVGVHAGEGGQEHGTFELPVSALWCVFAVDRGARLLRGGGQPGVRTPNEMIFEVVGSLRGR